MTLIKSLLRGRTFTVGLITTDYFGSFNMPVMAGIEDARRKSWSSSATCATIQSAERRVVSALMAKQVDGIIVMGRRVDPRLPISVGRSGLPVYAFSRTVEPDALYFSRRPPGHTRGHRASAGDRAAA